MSRARLEGKVALVSGIGSGIGQGTARTLARHGATVLGTDINGENAERTAEEARAEGLRLVSVAPFDLRSPGEVRSLFEQVASHGRLDILVNAAARFVGAPIEEMDFETHWRDTLAAELDTVFLVCQAAWPLLKASGTAAIVNFASINAHLAAPGLPTLVHSAGKAGVLGMTRELAKEGAPHGIRANTVSPGMVATNATRRFLDQPEIAARLTDRMMLRRLGRPEDIANAVAFLASDEALWITGADLPVDGGWTAW